MAMKKLLVRSPSRYHYSKAGELGFHMTLIRLHDFPNAHRFVWHRLKPRPSQGCSLEETHTHATLQVLFCLARG
jgi:hypothetical protein